MIIGVCGKVASGKSEVMNILQKKGFYCIFADKIVHDLYKKNGKGVGVIEAVFGQKFLDRGGSVNRIKLRNEVFSDANKLKILSNIIHPLVYEEVEKILAKRESVNVAIEGVHFDEACLGDFVDKIIWVERSRERVFEVLLHDRGLSSFIAENAYASVEKPKNVDFIIKNDADLRNLDKEIEKIIYNC